MALNSREILKDLKAHGWKQVGRRGSHVQLKHPTLRGRVTVPHPKRDLPAGTVASIYKQAGLAPPDRR